MNMIDAVAKLVAGNAITKANWDGGAIRAVQLDNGTYQLYVTGELTPEMTAVLSGDFLVKTEETA